MSIENIKICNYKSFDNEKIELGAFNILIGANASGKSNFITILKFLQDITKNGLDNAISMHGGVDYIRNINIGSDKNLSVEFQLNFKDDPVQLFGVDIDDNEDDNFTEIFVTDIFYKLSIEFFKIKKDYKSVYEKLEADCQFVTENSRKKKSKNKKKTTGKVVLINNKGKIEFTVMPQDTIIKKHLTPSKNIIRLMEKALKYKKLFIESQFLLFYPFAMLPFAIHNFSRDISLYDIDPKQLKKAVLITGKTDLEPDGSNLAIVLKKILDDKVKAEKLSNLIKDIMPFIDELAVEKLADKSLIALLKEVYSTDTFLPASLISDGTLNITALITALYFEDNSLIVFEEPERNIHPYLISKIIEMMKDVSERLNKQIIITTHNPEIVRHSDIETILLVHRDTNGFSRISKPTEKKEVKIFLENEMDISDLYVQNLLEW